MWHQARSTLPSRPRSIAKFVREVCAGFLQCLVWTFSARQCSLHSPCQLSWHGDGALPSVCHKGYNFWGEKQGFLAQRAHFLICTSTYARGLTREHFSSAPPGLQLPSLDCVSRFRSADTTVSALFAYWIKLNLLNRRLRLPTDPCPERPLNAGLSSGETTRDTQLLTFKI